MGGKKTGAVSARVSIEIRSLSFRSQIHLLLSRTRFAVRSRPHMVRKRTFLLR